MPYSIKAVLIIAAVAVAAFFAAEMLIPERSAVEAREGAAAKPPQARAAADSSRDGGDIPVVVVENQPVADAKAARVEPVDAKAAKTADARAARVEPVDTKAAKTADVRAARVEPVDAKAAKAVDTKTAAAPAPAVQPAAAQKKTAASYRIEKATLCSAIENREPQGVASKFSKDAPSVYYFTHLVGARDSTTVIHRWYQNGKLVQTSILPVKSNYWRTHSRRNLLTHNGDVTGQWRVDVVETGTNTVMESASFTIE